MVDLDFQSQDIAVYSAISVALGITSFFIDKRITVIEEPATIFFTLALYLLAAGAIGLAISLIMYIANRVL